MTPTDCEVVVTGSGAVPTGRDDGVEPWAEGLSVSVTMTEASVRFFGVGNVSLVKIPHRDESLGSLYTWVRWAENIYQRNPDAPITVPSWQEIGCTEDCADRHTLNWLADEHGCELVPFEWRDDASGAALDGGDNRG